MARLGYVTVGSNDLPRAKTFYDALLGSAGIRPLWEHPSGGRIYGTDEGYFFCVVGPYDGEPATPGNGAMFALQFDMRSQVDTFHARALSLGPLMKDRRVSARLHSTCPISEISTETSSVPIAWNEYERT